MRGVAPTARVLHACRVRANYLRIRLNMTLRRCVHAAEPFRTHGVREPGGGEGVLRFIVRMKRDIWAGKAVDGVQGKCLYGVASSDRCEPCQRT
ncbi:protein of unknown function [Streptomyces murinus]